MSYKPKYPKYSTNHTSDSLLTAHLWLIVAAATWFIPDVQQQIFYLDEKVFATLNNSISSVNWWTWFWGYLNHRNENWINALIMVGINFWIIFAAPKRERRTFLYQVIYYWLFFQFGLLILRLVFIEFMGISRASPTMVHRHAFLISKVLGNSELKDFSWQSFPAGHAFVAVYWASFTCTLISSKQWLAKLGILTIAGFICSARLVSGAHWLSDIYYTAPMAFAFFCWSRAFLQQWQIFSLD